MSEDNKELARRLFAAATALLEDAHELAVSGQSENLDSTTAYHTARRLRRAAWEVGTLATAASILIRKERDL